MLCVLWCHDACVFLGGKEEEETKALLMESDAGGNLTARDLLGKSKEKAVIHQ